MKFLVVDSIVSSGRLCSITTYNDNYNFQFQQILQSSQIDITEKAENKYICFDAFKIMDTFGSDGSKLYDVKVLYELAGYRFRNLIDLARDVLGEGRVLKYVGISDTIKAHLHSFKVAKINCNQYNIEKLLPEKLIENLYKERSVLLISLFEKFEKDEVVSFFSERFYDVMRTLHQISQVPIKLDSSSIKEDETHFATSLKSFGGEVNLKFNAVGAKTGRLGFRKNSLNVYNLPRSLRKCIVASEGYKIVQFDYKSFQPRLAIFSTEDESFKDKFKDVEDIYSMFPGDREKNKISFLSWMFSLRKDEMFEKEASAIQSYRTKLFYEAKKNGRLLNKFGRYMPYTGEEKNVVFQNYITSLEVDSVLSACVWVNKFLTNKKSRVLLSYHDALICEISKDEMSMIENIKDFMEMSSTGLDFRFPVDIKMGSNFSLED